MLPNTTATPGLLVGGSLRLPWLTASSPISSSATIPEARGSVQSFGAEMDRLERSWREELGTDARYQPYLEGPGRQVNSRLLDTCDRISVYLCASLPAPFEVWAQNAAGDTEVIGFEMVNDTTWRVQPWPLEGERLTLQCEGRRIAVDELRLERRTFRRP